LRREPVASSTGIWRIQGISSPSLSGWTWLVAARKVTARGHVRR
jgi:hypothetical protein